MVTAALPAEPGGGTPRNFALPLPSAIKVAQAGFDTAEKDNAPFSTSFISITYSYGSFTAARITGVEIKTGGSLTACMVHVKLREIEFTLGAVADPASVTLIVIL